MQPSQQPNIQPEQVPERSGSQVPAPKLEKAPNAPAGAPVTNTPPTSQPMPAQPAPAAQPPAQSTPAVSNTPAVADDVDVIEKEWVDAAQSVVANTSKDPHLEEEGFENLQVDYLKKRYSKDIKKPKE